MLNARKSDSFSKAEEKVGGCIVVHGEHLVPRHEENKHDSRNARRQEENLSLVRDPLSSAFKQ